MRTIKRYENRKLYDYQERHYITLAELAALVRAGEEVVVQTHDAGEDITAQTLALIIAEEEKRSARVPADVLARVIREGIPAQ